MERVDVQAATVTCPLCSHEIATGALACHSSCPLAEGCHIICCPNCGYQMVDESRSRAVSFLLGLKERFKGGREER